MKAEVLAQGNIGSPTLSRALTGASRISEFNRLEVAVAYATKQGIRTLEQALGSFPANTFWVVGLDDAITQPEALEYLLELPGSSLRLVALAPRRRFHPKLYCLSSTGDDQICVSAIGSGNMTLNGLRINGETAALLTAENPDDVRVLREQWAQMWRMGQAATQELLDEYRVRYRMAGAARRSIVRLGVAPVEPDPEAPVREPSTFDGDPGSAQIAWTEAGSPSAEGLDLEFPRILMPYFDLPPEGGFRRFRTQDGVIHSLKFTYRPNNKMWRLLFSADSVEAMIDRRSLRPGPSQRSEYAVKFERSNNAVDYDVTAVRITSDSFTELVESSLAVDGLKATAGNGGRQFGFY